MSKLWKLRELADYFNVSAETIRNWVDAGNLAGINVGTESRRVLCFADEDVRAFISARRSQPEPAQATPRGRNASKELDALLAK